MTPSPSSARPSLRLVAATLAVADLLFALAVWRRWRVSVPLLGPHDGDLSRWSHGVIAAYAVAQGAIALRPTPAGSRALAALRATLIGGDLAMATGGRTVDRRLGLPLAVCNATFAWAAWRAATPDHRPDDHHIPNKSQEDHHHV